MKSFSDDSNKHVDADCDPYLGLDGVLARTVEGLDAQVLCRCTIGVSM